MLKWHRVESQSNERLALVKLIANYENFVTTNHFREDEEETHFEYVQTEKPNKLPEKRKQKCLNQQKNDSGRERSEIDASDNVWVNNNRY